MCTYAEAAARFADAQEHSNDAPQQTPAECAAMKEVRQKEVRQKEVRQKENAVDDFLEAFYAGD